MCSPPATVTIFCAADLEGRAASKDDGLGVRRSATGARRFVAPIARLAEVIEPHVVGAVVKDSGDHLLHLFELPRTEEALEDALLHRRPEVLQRLVQAR